MPDTRPLCLIFAGPNGAGKSTLALRMLREGKRFRTFVNADVIAQGLDGQGTEAVAVQAGRIMLDRLDELVEERRDFAFETTLSGLGWRRNIRQWRGEGAYRISLVFIHIESPQQAIERVRQRVEEGGHFVPDAAVTRRYNKAHRNFFRVYAGMVDDWTLVDNRAGQFRMAARLTEKGLEILNDRLWQQLAGLYA